MCHFCGSALSSIGVLAKGKARNLRPVPLSLNRSQLATADRDAYSAGSVVTAQVPAAL